MDRRGIRRQSKRNLEAKKKNKATSKENRSFILQAMPKGNHARVREAAYTEQGVGGFFFCFVLKEKQRTPDWESWSHEPASKKDSKRQRRH